MGKVTFNANYLPRKNNNTGNPSLLLFDLPVLIGKMTYKQSWANCGLNAMVLLKTPGKQIILTTKHDGTEIQSFQTNDSITFQIIEGKIIPLTPEDLKPDVNKAEDYAKNAYKSCRDGLNSKGIACPKDPFNGQ